MPPVYHRETRLTWDPAFCAMVYAMMAQNLLTQHEPAPYRATEESARKMRAALHREGIHRL